MNIANSMDRYIKEYKINFNESNLDWNYLNYLLNNVLIITHKRKKFENINFEILILLICMKL